MNSVQRFMVNNVGGSDFISKKMRIKIMKWAGFKIGSRVLVRQHVFFDSNSVFIGDGSFINRFCSFQDGGHNATLKIGKEVRIGPNCIFLGATHKFGDSRRRAMGAYVGNVIIEDGCWLGGNVTVLPGVTIKKGCIIGAGAVVTKDTEPDGVYVGIPAKRIKSLN